MWLCRKVELDILRGCQELYLRVSLDLDYLKIGGRIKMSLYLTNDVLESGWYMKVQLGKARGG